MKTKRLISLLLAAVFALSAAATPALAASAGSELPALTTAGVDETNSVVSIRLTAELDVFEGDLAPLTLVEVEFDSVDAANEFTAPDWFGEDVTESGKYHNSYLSRLENS